MNENQLILTLITAIRAGLTAQGIAADSVGIKQNYQPVQQGATVTDCIYLHKLHSRRFGWAKRTDVFVPSLDNGVTPDAMEHTETQKMLSTFQVNATVIVNPANLVQVTAEDYLNAVAFSLQYEGATALLQSQSIGIDRITDVKQPYATDEKSRNEASPSFDFTVVHDRTITVQIPYTRAIVPNVAAI